MRARPQIDSISFSSSLAVIALVCVPLALFADSGGQWLLDVYELIASQLGFLYIAAGAATLVFLLFLAGSKYGRIVLGPKEVGPEFSTVSWAGMLFCAGVGAGLMFWAPVEWAYYYDAPPFGVTPRSDQAAEWAAAYGLFHWGPTAWAFYCLPTLAIAYPYYNRGVKQLRFSASCHGLLGASATTSGAGRVIDILFMVALLGGAGSSIGFTTPMIAACLGELFGVEPGYQMELVAVTICVLLFATSVWFGLRRGIKRLSDLNLILALLLLAYVLTLGPTVELCKLAVNSIGLMTQNFARLNTWTDPFGDGKFVKDWTVFYWAWWIAYGPFVGLFVTRISRGRTIRQVIAGMLLLGSLGGGLFYLILGNYGLLLELAGNASITTELKDAGQSAAILVVLNQLPFPLLVVGVFGVVSIVFTATTYDSASYILAASATAQLEADTDPARWHRLFWAVALAVLPLTLMAIGHRQGDPRNALKIVQTATLAASLPILGVSVLMSIALWRDLRQGEKSDEAT